MMSAGNASFLTVLLYKDMSTNSQTERSETLNMFSAGVHVPAALTRCSGILAVAPAMGGGWREREGESLLQ